MSASESNSNYPSNSNHNILAHLAGVNPYVQSNAVANLPREPQPQPPAQSLTNIIRRSINTDPLTLQTTAHKLAYEMKQNDHLWPNKIAHTLYVVKKASPTLKNIGDRTTIINSMRCDNHPIAIKNELKLQLLKLKIMDDVDNWDFGWTTGPSKPSYQIWDYNCQTDDNIKWEELSHFTLRERSIVSEQDAVNGNNKREKNKRDFKLKASQMEQGEKILRDTMDKEIFAELKKQGRLFVLAKYKAV